MVQDSACDFSSFIHSFQSLALGLSVLLDRQIDRWNAKSSLSIPGTLISPCLFIPSHGVTAGNKKERPKGKMACMVLGEMQKAKVCFSDHHEFDIIIVSI